MIQKHAGKVRKEHFVLFAIHKLQPLFTDSKSILEMRAMQNVMQPHLILEQTTANMTSHSFLYDRHFSAFIQIQWMRLGS